MDKTKKLLLSLLSTRSQFQAWINKKDRKVKLIVCVYLMCFTVSGKTKEKGFAPINLFN